MFKTIRLKCNKFTISAIKDDLHLTPWLHLGDEWDEWMRKDLKLFYKKGTDIIDVGAHIGTNSLMFSDYGPVHAYEPVFNTILTKNVEQNTLLNPVKVYAHGLSNEKKEMDIFIPKRGINNRINYVGASIHGCPGCSDKFHRQVALDKLDDVYSGKPSVIKIDVGGHEMFVLQGAMNILKKHKPTLIIEIHNYSEDIEVVKFLKSLGYNTPEARPVGNYLFISPNLQGELEA